MQKSNSYKSMRNITSAFILILLVYFVFYLVFSIRQNPTERSVLASPTRSALEKTWSSKLDVSSKPIEHVCVGERVRGRNPLVSDEERSLFEDIASKKEQYRKITIAANDTKNGRTDIVLLRDISWIESIGIEEGSSIHLDLEELGVYANAYVVSIEGCPYITKGNGNIVTGTFKHYENLSVLYIYIQGRSEPIGCTSNHPFWSATDQVFKQASELRKGELVRLFNGEKAPVADIQVKNEQQPVYNIEVYGEHVYEVSASGVLVHNKAMFKSLPDTYRAQPGDVMTYAEWENLTPTQKNGMRGHHPLPQTILTKEGAAEAAKLGIDPQNSPIIVLSVTEHYDTVSYGGKMNNADWMKIKNSTDDSILIQALEYGMEDDIIKKNYPQAWTRLAEDFFDLLTF